jgi:hypothetical protein
MSFIKDESNQGWKIGDWIVLALLLGGGFGGWFYFTHSKSESLEQFSRADQLFQEGKYEEAMELYDQLQNAAWKNDSLDSLLYLRSAQLNEWKTTELELFRAIDSLAQAGETEQTKQRLEELGKAKFLAAEQLERIEEIREGLSEEPSPSTEEEAKGASAPTAG